MNLENDIEKSFIPQKGAGAKPANSSTFIPFKAISCKLVQQCVYFLIPLMVNC